MFDVSKIISKYFCKIVKASSSPQLFGRKIYKDITEVDKSSYWA